MTYSKNGITLSNLVRVLRKTLMRETNHVSLAEGEGGREGRREEGREGEREGGREGGTEKERERGREGGTEKERERGRDGEVQSQLCSLLTFQATYMYTNQTH